MPLGFDLVAGLVIALTASHRWQQIRPWSHAPEGSQGAKDQLDDGLSESVLGSRSHDLTHRNMAQFDQFFLSAQP
jgi:hypothetical protein